jgi:hypothetical protein
LLSHRSATLPRIDAAELRAQARAEADELGPIPLDPRERELWAEDRRGAIVLLASLAESNAQLLRRAALEPATEWTTREARDLLLEAALECD